MIHYSYEILEKNIPIECVEDEHDSERDFEPSFWYWNKRYYLNDFIRVHNNPWVLDDYPSFIHGYESENYYSPLFIGLDDACETVTVYREVQNVD